MDYNFAEELKYLTYKLRLYLTYKLRLIWQRKKTVPVSHFGSSSMINRTSSYVRNNVEIGSTMAQYLNLWAEMCLQYQKSGVEKNVLMNFIQIVPSMNFSEKKLLNTPFYQIFSSRKSNIVLRYHLNWFVFFVTLCYSCAYLPSFQYMKYSFHSIQSQPH